MVIFPGEDRQATCLPKINKEYPVWKIHKELFHEANRDSRIILLSFYQEGL